MDGFLAEVERRAYRVAVIRVRDPDDALDIVQDAMLRLVRAYGSRPPAEWPPLFYRILDNRIRDHQRRAQLRRRWTGWLGSRDDDPQFDPVQAVPGDGREQPERQAASDSAMARLEVAIAALPARQQQAFLLRALEGLDVAGTARAMGCSQGSVKTHYSRAVHSLRAQLGDHW